MYVDMLMIMLRIICDLLFFSKSAEVALTACTNTHEKGAKAHNMPSTYDLRGFCTAVAILV